MGAGAGLGDVKAWILREGYYVKAPAQQRAVEIFESTAGELGGAFRRDYSLVSSSSVESFVEMRRRLRSDCALAWALIKAYYSAYFSAHAIMRLHGSASIWADQSHVASVGRVVDLWIGAIGEPPQRGAWIVSGVDGLAGLEIRGVGSSAGGSHENFWSVFCEFLKQLEQRVVTSGSLIPASVTKSIILLQSLRFYLESGEIVRTRHEVNYRRGYGVWFPFDGAIYDDRFSERLQARLVSADYEIPEDFSRLGNLDRAAAACRGLVALNVELLKAMQERYPDTTKDLRIGALRLLAQAKAA